MNYFRYTSKVGLAASDGVAFSHSVKVNSVVDEKVRIELKIKISTIETSAPKKLVVNYGGEDFPVYLLDMCSLEEMKNSWREIVELPQRYSVY